MRKAEDCLHCPLFLLEGYHRGRKAWLIRDCTVEICQTMTSGYTDDDVELLGNMHKMVMGEPASSSTVRRWRKNVTNKQENS